MNNIIEKDSREEKKEDSLVSFLIEKGVVVYSSRACLRKEQTAYCNF